MKFCSDCGSDRITFAIPDGDNRERHLCPDCGAIHYTNPRIIAGVLPVWEDRILLCKRSIEPRKDFWTLPAGFLENGETLQQGAERETREEALAHVDIHDIYTIFNLTHINQVYVFFRGTLIDGAYGVGEESADADLFAEHEIPWNELAFPTIHKTLKFYLQDRQAGEFPVRMRDLQAGLKRKS
jgi:ADP-ribose pyrophosphatase YjhB (NUDIX family)